jgi:hypothetical protein
VIKFQGYLSGSAFALLLAAHVAMELLHAYPVNQYLWHLNIIFAREARPLLQHIDWLAGGNSAATILALGGLALLGVVSARATMRLLAAANCHIALAMFVFLAARSYVRTYPHGLPANDMLASLAAKLSVVQFGIFALILVLSVVCVMSHAEILGRGFARRRRSASPALRDVGHAASSASASARLRTAQGSLETNYRPSAG